MNVELPFYTGSDDNDCDCQMRFFHCEFRDLGFGPRHFRIGNERKDGMSVLEEGCNEVDTFVPRLANFKNRSYPSLRFQLTMMPFDTRRKSESCGASCTGREMFDGPASDAAEVEKLE